MSDLKQTDRTTITRLAKRGSYDKETILEILKEGIVCHVSFIHEGQPYLLPNLYGVKDDIIYIHGSVGSFLQRSLSKQIDLCFAVTHLDGLVLARSAFNHSANYRSVVVFGKATVVETENEKMAALEALTEHIVPGRWPEVRLPTKNELKQTTVLSIPLIEASAKIRTGPPNDDAEDYKLDVWAGVLPIVSSFATAIPDPKLTAGIPTPESVINFQR